MHFNKILSVIEVHKILSPVLIRSEKMKSIKLKLIENLGHKRNTKHTKK